MATPIPVNLCEFTLAEVARATGGTLAEADGALRVRGVCTDSRAVTPGALFVALAGESFDGHAFVAKARAQGASVALVARGAGATGPRVEVDHTLAALGELARFHAARVRQARRVPSVAITGSAGKTTTKELTAACVQAVFGPSLVTRGNLNNLVGVPMTLFTLGDEHAAMVIECGTSARGEIDRLARIVAPDVGVVLNADAGHTAGIGTVEDVADEKGAMFAHAARVALGNADDPVSSARMARCGARRATFGRAAGADARLVSVEPTAEGRARVAVQLSEALRAAGATGRVEFTLGLLGDEAALDAAAALGATAAMREGGLSDDDAARAGEAMGSVRAVPGRLAPRVLGEALVIDDTYNANPRSVRASLRTAKAIAARTGGRLLAVLGDMLELGELSDRLHAEVGEEAVRVGADVLVTVGEQMALAARVAAASAGSAPGRVVVETQRADDAATVVGSVLRPGDVVLVKGSRGMRMEQVVEALLRALPGAGEGASP